MTFLFEVALPTFAQPGSKCKATGFAHREQMGSYAVQSLVPGRLEIFYFVIDGLTCCPLVYEYLRLHITLCFNKVFRIWLPSSVQRFASVKLLLRVPNA